MTYEELFKKLKPHLPAHMLFGIVQKREKGYRVQLVDITYMTRLDNGEHELTATVPITLYTSDDLVVNFIEHSYNAFTWANKQAVQDVVSLIDEKITDLPDVAEKTFDSVDEVIEFVKNKEKEQPR